MTKTMDIDNKPEGICSVAAMARKLKLSRPRFYQLLQAGVFPPPVYDIRTRRPFYPPDLQGQCLQIRRAGITAKGQPVLFYTPRKNKGKMQSLPMDRLERSLAELLKKMGLQVTQKQLKKAIAEVYPQGLPQTDDLGPVLRNLFRHLREGL